MKMGIPLAGLPGVLRRQERLPGFLFRAQALRFAQGLSGTGGGFRRRGMHHALRRYLPSADGARQVMFFNGRASYLAGTSPRPTCLRGPRGFFLLEYRVTGFPRLGPAAAAAPGRAAAHTRLCALSAPLGGRGAARIFPGIFRGPHYARVTPVAGSSWRRPVSSVKDYMDVNVPWLLKPFFSAQKALRPNPWTTFWPRGRHPPPCSSWQGRMTARRRPGWPKNPPVRRFRTKEAGPDPRRRPRGRVPA